MKLIIDREKTVDEAEKRKAKNADLIARMKAGESTSLYIPQATWFPPRPIIEKDKDIVKKLFEVEDE